MRDAINGAVIPKTANNINNIAPIKIKMAAGERLLLMITIPAINIINVPRNDSTEAIVNNAV